MVPSNKVATAFSARDIRESSELRVMIIAQAKGARLPDQVGVNARRLLREVCRSWVNLA